MSRRLLAAALAAAVAGIIGGSSAPAASALCIGFESQRQPGNFHGICLDPGTQTTGG